jgi:transcriptional regulator GlxA family with amidase domain
VGYVHDHAHEDISVGDLAEAAGATRQAVHLAFRQHLQTTPRHYLDRIRLDRAHRDLTDLDPRTTTVGQVAMLWGFTEPERFRRYYCRSYGTSPEQTLRG